MMPFRVDSSACVCACCSNWKHRPRRRTTRHPADKRLRTLPLVTSHESVRVSQCRIPLAFEDEFGALAELRRSIVDLVSKGFDVYQHIHRDRYTPSILSLTCLTASGNFAAST